MSNYIIIDNIKKKFNSTKRIKKNEFKIHYKEI